MLIEDSIISSNKSDSETVPSGEGNGGGIYNDSSQSFRMVRSQVIGNSTGNANGGGYFSSGADDVIEDTLFSANVSPVWGGNIYHGGAGQLEMIRSSIDSGVAHFGGGMAQMGGTLYIQNVTIANNILGATTLGGGVYVGSAALTISFSTIAGNQAASGAGIYNDDGTILMADSIIAQNFTPSAALANCAGDDLTSVGYNLSDGNSCSLSSATHDLPDTPAGLGVYAPDHPRYPFIRSFTLLSGSAAIDAAAPDSMIQEDGRYLARGVDGNGDGFRANDIGAYEYGQFYVFLPMIGR